MKRMLAIILITTFIVLTVFAHGQAEVEWTLHRTFKTQKPPRDMETSVNGKWVFILTEQGEILIYSSNGVLQDTIVVGDSIDSIKAGPREDILFLSSHKFARPAAVAALAAERQGKFWEFHDKLYENYNRFNRQKIQGISQELGLDAVKFENDMRDSQLMAMIKRDKSEGVLAGVTGTPAVFLNGKLLRNRRLAGFQAAIEKELQKLRAARNQ